ncbi:SDR family oxidoreductase [Vagococcus sp. PNs007]|uniref:SDR family oxidoreductase n=1 Tax=Vagococcus proximus TaxID=2991417 RepID=A0ABT5X012_9ENTE|nr:SDR family oxidoreductase [Vagococcus proximus]MDF0479338.1 SDR family oxidoreductase [Vagococcus proximus]
MTLDGKVCLVTGASKGIGRAITELFAEQGAIVYAVARNIDDLNKWVVNKAFQSKVIPISFDLKNISQIKQIFLRMRKEQGKIDVVVNNAGIEYNERIGMISQKNLQDMFELNVFSTIEIIQLASRIMAPKKCGSIINISSVVGIKGNSGQLSYSATKGAINSVTLSAAKELASNNIRVNAVAPGLTETTMLDDAKSEELEKRINNIKLGRLAKVDDIANAVLFLASDASEYISGQILSVDGCSIF